MYVCTVCGTSLIHKTTQLSNMRGVKIGVITKLPIHLCMFAKAKKRKNTMHMYYKTPNCKHLKWYYDDHLLRAEFTNKIMFYFIYANKHTYTQSVFQLTREKIVTKLILHNRILCNNKNYENKTILKLR